MAENTSAPPSADSNKCDLDISTDQLNQRNSLITEDTSKWLIALENFVKTTEATYFSLDQKRVGVKEAAAVYKILRDSQVIDLSINCNKLRGGIEDLLQLLVASKIETLSLCRCIFSNDEWLHLIKSLKDTPVSELEILDCESSDNDPIEFDPEEGKEFISHLLKSRLTLLNFQPHFVQPVDDALPFPPADITPLLGIMHETSITNLDLSNTTFSSGVLTSFFSTLSRTAITDLNLRNTEIGKEELQQFSLNLKESKLEILDLSGNFIKDSELDILVKGLTQSKVTSLNLSETSITGSSSLGCYLKDTQVTDLNLSYNDITSENLFSFPEFLKFSSIKMLDISNCYIGDELGQKLMKSLKSSKVTHLFVSYNTLHQSSISVFSDIVKDTDLSFADLSYNFFPLNGAVKLGDCLKESKLKTINLNSAFASCCTNPTRALSTFLEKTKGSSLNYVDMATYKLEGDDMREITTSLVNTTFTSFDFSNNHIGDNITTLAPQLKFTAITHLYLGHNGLGDAGVETLANCLKETKIIHLDLHYNAITDFGAEVLATALKGTSLLELQLAGNQINNKGLEVLAKHIEGSFITVLDVTANPGNRTLLLDRILYENKISTHKFLNFFERIAPDSDNSCFEFDSNIEDNDENVEVFLEECLVFYKTALEQSSAASALAEDPCVSLSRDEIATLLFEEFPKQFTSFVLNKIEASATQHVDFLKRAEELGLSTIVEPLLLNRPALTIDQNANILHPYVYNLLRKYKQPLFNLSIEPEGKTKIIEYFKDHSDVEGAVDVLNMLCNNLSQP